MLGNAEFNVKELKTGRAGAWSQHRQSVADVEHPRRGMSPMKLSVLMAAHNEARTIEYAVRGVLGIQVSFDLELIVVDDGSSDNTPAVLERIDDDRLTVIRHEACRGKGAAVLTAAGVASGTHVLIFDADLEYSAEDIPSLVDPVLRGECSVVYGVRVPGMRTYFPSLWYAFGSRVTTVFANIVFDAWMTDMHTCLKLMPLRMFRQLTLSERGFGLDSEITGEVLRRGIRPYEVPCSYKGRSVAEGKKISTRDGLRCLRTLVAVRLRGLVDGAAEEIEPLRVLPEVGEDVPVAAHAI